MIQYGFRTNRPYGKAILVLNVFLPLVLGSAFWVMGCSANPKLKTQNSKPFSVNADRRGRRKNPVGPHSADAVPWKLGARWLQLGFITLQETRNEKLLGEGRDHDTPRLA